MDWNDGLCKIGLKFDAFVERFGGECIRTLIPNINPPKNSDYLFRNPMVVAELKCLERDAFTPQYKQRMQILVQNWRRGGLILTDGRAPVRLANVPAQCQSEWIEILQSPLQKNIVAAANRQIRETKKALDLPSAKGLLLFANSGNYSLQPNDVFILLARILNKKNRDGFPQYSSIHSIVYFSTDMTAKIPGMDQNVAFWRVGRRSEEDSAFMDFLEFLRCGWLEYCSEMTGTTPKGIEQDPDSFKNMKFVRPVEVGKQNTRTK